jgi:putative copper export protein
VESAAKKILWQHSRRVRAGFSPGCCQCAEEDYERVLQYSGTTSVSSPISTAVAASQCSCFRQTWEKSIMYDVALFLHVLGATIWTGGHIVLAGVVLPRVLRERSPERLLEFESVYEKIGMPALVVQIVTGIYLAHRLLPDVSQWLDFSNPVAAPIALKLTLLALTFAFALDAKFRVLPNLRSDTLLTMAWHIIPVTILSVLFVATGVSFRTGWWHLS